MLQTLLFLFSFNDVNHFSVENRSSLLKRMQTVFYFPFFRWNDFSLIDFFHHNRSELTFPNFFSSLCNVSRYLIFLNFVSFGKSFLVDNYKLVLVWISYGIQKPYPAALRTLLIVLFEKVLSNPVYTATIFDEKFPSSCINLGIARKIFRRSRSLKLLGRPLLLWRLSISCGFASPFPA